MALKPEQIAKHTAHSQARQIANDTALPGPLAEAFEPSPITVGSLVLVEMTAAHRALLDKIKSPYILHARELGRWAKAKERGSEEKPPETPFSDEEIYETLFVLTRPARESRALLALSREAFREGALAVTADLLTPLQEPLVNAAIEQVFLRAYATQVEVTSSGGADDGNFTQQPTSLAPSTALDTSGEPSPTSPASSTPPGDSTGSGTNSP